MDKAYNRAVNSSASRNVLLSQGQRLAMILLLTAVLITPTDASMPKYWFKLKERLRSHVFNNHPIRGRYRNAEALQYYRNGNRAKITKSSHFESRYVLGHKIAFICVAHGNPRPAITWRKDGKEIDTHKFLKLWEWHIGEYQVKSKMEIDPTSQMDKGIYQCFADNMFAIDVKAFRTSY